MYNLFLENSKDPGRSKLQSYIKMYMDIARRVAKMSYAERTKVGAILVKNGRILSMGWNGMPRGWENKC